jgi:hypothetical protein
MRDIGDAETIGARTNALLDRRIDAWHAEAMGRIAGQDG